MPTDRPLDYPDPLPDIFLTGTINLLSGSPNVGKTTLMAWMATKFRDGLPIFGHKPPHPYWIGYITNDRPWASNKRAFTRAGYPDIPQFSFVDDCGKNFTRAERRDKYKRVDMLVRALELLKVPDGGIIIVDPLARFIGNNLNDADLVSDCCLDLHQYLIPHNLLLIGLMHASKQSADAGKRYMSPFDQMSGSVALQGHANTQMHLMAPEQSKSGLHEFWWNSHHHAIEMFKLKRDARGLFTSADDDSVRMGGPIPVHCQALYTQFPVAPARLAITQIFALFPDASRPTVYRWLKTLIDMGYIESPSHGFYQRIGDVPAPIGETPAD